MALPLRFPSIALSAISVGALSGCTGRKPNRAELVGLYAVRHPYGLHQLSLNADGTFDEVFRLPSSRVLKQSGKWSIENTEEWSVVLRNCLDRNDLLRNTGDGRIRTTSDSYPVRKHLDGSITLEVYGEDGSFKRITKPAL